MNSEKPFRLLKIKMKRSLLFIEVTFYKVHFYLKLQIRIVLNKSDLVNPQHLMRVYGALMWSLGKVFDTPEVVRVYIGSFGDRPFVHSECEDLFNSEMMDLLSVKKFSQHYMKKLNFNYYAFRT